jgi:hypothetical protein
MLRDARNQLEGRIEVLERAVATRPEAIALARRDEFSLLAPGAPYRSRPRRSCGWEHV